MLQQVIKRKGHSFFHILNRQNSRASVFRFFWF